VGPAKIPSLLALFLVCFSTLLGGWSERWTNGWMVGREIKIEANSAPEKLESRLIVKLRESIPTFQRVNCGNKSNSAKWAQ
jgi:hypothetical protein